MEKKTVLITGGSSGIGFEMAKQMDDLGHTVIICGRSEEKLLSCKTDRESLIVAKCDITKKEDRFALLCKIKNDHGKLDILVNNAGRCNRYLFNIESEENFETRLEDDYQINFKAPLMMAKTFASLLSKASGTLVNISTGLIYVPLFIQPSYCANKAALHSMTISLRHQLKEINVKVIEVMYPEVDTPFNGGLSSARAIKPDAAAQQALKGILAGKDEVHVGMAGKLRKLSKLIPGRIFKKLSSFVPANITDLLYNSNVK